MFIRFITEFRNDNGVVETGVFQAAEFLRLSTSTFDFDKTHLKDLLTWFSRHLSKPDRFSKDRRRNAEKVSLSWFKTTAVVHLQKMYEMKQLLEKYDLHVTVVKRMNPGYIVYEDSYQVSTLPHGKEKHLLK
jgi:hypothetical protein